MVVEALARRVARVMAQTAAGKVLAVCCLILCDPRYLVVRAAKVVAQSAMHMVIHAMVQMAGTLRVVRLAVAWMRRSARAKVVT